MADRPAASVLIVDDTAASRYAVSRTLRKAGYAVEEASTGGEALRLAAAGPDLVILDVNLPDMSGYEVCQRIKADPVTASIPVLHLSSSFVHSENRSEGLESGADGYLVYPLEPRELLANVEAMLRIRRAERAVRDQRELLRVTLGSIADGVIATDAKGVVTFINAAAHALTGWPEGDAAGKPLGEVFRLIDEQTGGSTPDPVCQVLQTGRIPAASQHKVLVARDGTRRPIDDSAAPIRDDAGRSVGVVLVFRDVSERRSLEAEIRRKMQDLADRDQRKDEFLAMLAHELRNPLAPIRNGLEYLRLSLGKDPNFGQVGAMMGRQLDHLVRLVDDLMDVSRISRGKIELRKEPVDLGTAVTRTLETMRPAVELRGHQLEVTLPAEPVTIEADPARLEQIVGNLLANAAKYTRPRGRIELAVGREGDQAFVRVRDNGIGIRPEMLERIFDTFQQADRVAGQLSEGLGVGLSLVRRLTELHGGSVTAFSEGPDRGSEFVVRFPAVAHPAAAYLAPPSVSSAVEPFRILVVDDNPAAAESLAELLRLGGHEVRTAPDGRSALEVAADFVPRAVLLDIGLPGDMDGYEVARRLRVLPGMDSAFLVALTGYGQDEDRRRSQEAGIQSHLVKPADPAALRGLLASAIPRSSVR
jgi:PAS domain S-box-containing protein